MAEFDYKQRPFSSRLTDEEYDRAVGRTYSPESSPESSPVTLCTLHPEYAAHVCPYCEFAQAYPVTL